MIGTVSLLVLLAHITLAQWHRNQGGRGAAAPSIKVPLPRQCLKCKKGTETERERDKSLLRKVTE